MTDEERLEKAVETLGEFFDTVQVFVSRHDTETNCTYKVECGSGNLLARMYQAEVWLGEQQPQDENEEEND